MDNIYNSRFNIQKEKTSSVSQFAENSLMAKYVLRVAMLLLMCANVFSYAQADTWDGTYDKPAAGTANPNALQLGNYFGGSGTEADPYTIRSAKEFATFGYLCGKVMTGGSNFYGYFKLTTDVDLNGSAHEWIFGEACSQGLQGVFDGGGHTISNMKIVVRSTDNPNNTNSQYRYGLFCAIRGTSAKTAAMKNFTLKDPVVEVESVHSSNDHMIGFLMGNVHAYAEFKNIKIDSPVMTFKASQLSNWYTSTAIAYSQNNVGMHVNNVVVKNPSVTSTGTLTYRANNSNVRFFFGGVVGYMYSSNNTVSTTSTVNNCGVTGSSSNIDFTAYQPDVVGNYARNLFMVGGVIGVCCNPHKYPENLYFTGKIFAPFAVVAPCLASTQDNSPGYDHIIGYYGGEYEGNTDEVERSASSSWSYGDYKIGLYYTLGAPTAEGSNYYVPADATYSSTKRYVNYTSSDVEDDGTGKKYVAAHKLVRHNRFVGTPRRSSTVLWWTERFNSTTDTKASVAPTSLSDWTTGEQYMFPEYNKNATVFPWYYMYYAQGVNRDTKYLASAVASDYETALEKNVETAMGKTGAKKITLTLTDNNKGQRGFDAHEFEVAATGDDASDLTYQWYVDGVAQGTGTTQSVTPSFNYTQGYQNGTNVIVVAKKDATVVAQATSYLPVVRLRFKGSESAGTKTDNNHTYVYDAGTKAHPYLINSDKDLRLLSEQMKQTGSMRQEFIYFSSGLNSGKQCYYRNMVQNVANNSQISYNQAYYELDGNVTMDSSKPFLPIGPSGYPMYYTDGTNGTYNNNFSFVGSFDGKGYTISGLRETWSSGYLNGSGAHSSWGLFSVVGHTTQYYKVGETTATNAAVRNLTIDDAVFTHDTSNTSFYYPGTDASKTSGNANRCSIGALTGVAGNFSTIENIVVTNTSINDAGTSTTYKLGAQRLSIGGVIGRATASFTSDNSTLANAEMRYLSSDADIDIQKAEFSVTNNAQHMQKFNVGGIVGSLHSNAAQNTVPFPRPSVYTGRIRARNAMAGPIFGYVSWNGFAGENFRMMAAHYTGKTSATAVFDATGMYYSNFDIYTESTKQNYSGTNYTAGYKRITETYPPVTSNFGYRSIKETPSFPDPNSGTNSDATAGNYASDGELYEYQGANAGNFAEAASTDVTDAFNDYSTLTDDQQLLIKDYKWNWSSDTGSNVGGSRPIVTIGEVSGLFVVAKDTYTGTSLTEDHVLTATVNSASTETRYYQWYKKVRVDGVDQDVAIDGATAASYTATPNIHNQYIFCRATIGESHADSEVLLIPKTDEITASADKTGSEHDWTMQAKLSLSPTTSATATTLTDAGFEVTYQWYKGSVSNANKSTEIGNTTANLSVTTYETVVRYCVITVVDNTVPSTYTETNTWQFTVSKLPANVMVVYLDPENGSDSNEGKDKDHPVKSWHKAYSLLVDDVTWDDNVIVLMSNSDYNRTKEGFMLDGSLTGGNTDTAANWEAKTWTNTDTHADASYRSGLANSNMWKNVTITGKWEGNDYSSTGKNTAKIYFGSSENHGIGLFGDTKFKNLTFDSEDTRYHIIYCQYHDLEMGDGVITKGMGDDVSYGKVAGAHDLDLQIFGGFLNDRRFRDDTNGFDYTRMQGNMANGKPWMPHGKDGFKINIKSGHYSVICASYRQNDDSDNHGQGIIGTPNMPVRCSINVDIDRAWNDEPAHKNCITSGGTAADYDIGLILAGNHEGAMYGNVDINVYSGHVGRIASGTLGALRTSNAHWWTGHYLPFNAFMGRANILIDPSQSRFASAEETAEVKNARVILTEMYGGGVGRALSGNGMITIPFYGQTSITMNGGTFKLLPEGNTDTTLFPGIYATGAGGVNGMYHVAETVSDNSAQRLPYWVTDKNGQVDYGDWNTFNTHRGAQKVYIKCYEDFDVAGDSLRYTLIDPEDAQTTVILNDGMYGTASKPIDGIYGGGSGYTPTVWLANTSTSYPNYRSGNIYGKEDADHPVASVTINGGDFYLKNGVFAGGRGTDYYYKTNRTNSGAGNAAAYSNYTTLGQIFGDVELNISGGHFHHDTSGAAAYKGDVYGAGLGVGEATYNNQPATTQYLTDMARIYGTTKVNITGGIIEGSVYGGGAMGDVGYGTATRESQTYEIGTKNAVTVKIENATVGGNIFAGSLKSDIYGSTVTTINDTEIGGNIFGGGNGELDGSGNVTASADIKGNTTVTLGVGSYFVKRSGSDFVSDYSTPHFVYGGGNLASVIGIYNNSSDAEITDIEGTDMATTAKTAKSGGNTTVNINNGVGTGQLSVFGAGYGANTYVNMTTVNVNNFQTLRTDSAYNEGTGKYDKSNHVVGLKEVYGGGTKGTVFTNTNVNMKGGLVLGNVFGGGNEAPVGTLIPDAQITAHDYAPYGTMVSLASTDANIYGNIYGGGNKDIVKGISQVSVSAGSFAGEVFGGGKGELSSNVEVGNSADVIGQTAVFVNGAHVIWDRFWDEATSSFIVWDGVTTTGATAEKFITMDGSTPVFKKNHNIYGGGELACVVTDTARVQVTNGAVPSALIKKTVWKNAFNDDANPHFYVFGGGYGAFTQAKSTDVTVGVEGYFSDDEDESTSEQWALNIPLEGENTITATNDDTTIGIYGNNYGIGGYTVLGVIGGGYAGLVKEDTNVKLGGTTFVHRVYGGGYGQLAAYNDLASATRLDNQTNQKNSIIESSRTREQLGEVGGNTHVTVSLSKPDEKGRTGGVYGDVFGGGAGVESTKSGGDYTDYQYMGQVLGVTRVDITENARVYGNVYGGGDVANVTNTSYADSTTVVKLRGGDVFGDVFGGGKGRLATEADDYTVLGNIFGNSNVIVNDSIKTETIDEVEQTVTVSPNIWGNIYGGGQVGDIKKTTEPTPRYGNTSISINGGNVGGDVYGAGLGDLGELDRSDVLSGSKSEYDFDNKSSADVEGNTNMVINGGSFLWKQAAETDGNIKTLVEAQIDRETALAIIAARKDSIDSPELLALQENFADIFDYKNNQFIRDHNIYGGGNSASLVSGSSTITVNHGMLNDDVAYFDDKNWNLSSLLTQLVTDNNSHPQFSVFGGGYGIKTTITGNATVNVQVGKDIDGDGDTDNDDYTSQTLDRATWTSLYAKFTTDYAAVPEATKDALYGGSGANGQFRYNTSRLANCFSIPNHTFMDIVGGGMAGLVNGSTQVNVSDQSMCQNIIGGGIGIEPADVEVTRSGKKTERLTPTGYETFGKVGGSSTVNITGAIVAGNVYGGGAGVESVDTDKDNTPDIDFTKIGAVGKTTSVTIDGTPDGTIIFGKVYGGGDIADVANTDNVEDDDTTAAASTVLIKGGCVYQQVFAGGSGRIASECADYTTLGKVYGNTKVTIQNNETPANSPWLWNRVYGGGSYGSVAKNGSGNGGNTYVNIEGGHLGYNIFGAGLGDVRTLDNGTESVTSSDVAGDTHVNISGGEWCLSQMWDLDKKNWVERTGSTSAQFDDDLEKFKINHNIYGGGNAASRVEGNTNINMTKGLLLGATNLGHDDAGRTATSLFASEEWTKVYNKAGSFHFTVIGGGYGGNTSVGTTNVDVNLTGDANLAADDSEESADVLKDDLSGVFKTAQSVLDVIGGGYNGEVRGTTNVTIEGDPYLRRVYGGSFYADVAKTNVLIKSANVDEVFGGCMMGDVTSTDDDAITLNLGVEGEADNNKIFVNHDVYGGNDVSGQVNGQINVSIKGGKIYNNVYGAGNGDYLYRLNEAYDKVTTIENEVVDGKVIPLIYDVPRRTELMPASAASSSEAARLVNINSFRPLSQYINLSVAGSSTTPVKILHKLFGGGNTATVTQLDGSKPEVTVNIGSYVTIDEVFMGSDGDAMFSEGANSFLADFIRLNDVQLANGINWVNDPYNKAIPTKFLPLSQEERVTTFPYIIDLYFQPVEMSIQPTLKWNGVVSSASSPGSYSLTNTTIGSFYCGGNRGNMDVTPDADGNAVDYIFPAGLTIKDKIVGGCSNANYTNTDLGLEHKGGYLLGKRATNKAMIMFKVAEGCNIKPYSVAGSSYYTGGNIYGGCYSSGTINGDIHIDVHANMVDGLSVAKLAATDAAKISAGNIFGGGNGIDSYVYGNVEVAFGTSATASAQNTSTSVEPLALDIPIDGIGEKKATDTYDTTFDDDGFSVNSIYGGGERGNVIGNTIVKVLNGHVAGDVCGGSYAGTQYGSTHVFVGYPDYYKAKASGEYVLMRADKANDIRNFDNSKAIKDTIRLIAGDFISPVVYDAICEYDAANGKTQHNNFTVQSVNAPANWNNISILIDEGVYGGGYELNSGYSGTGGAGSYTIKKYTQDNNVNNSNAIGTEDPLYNSSTVGYGGNTTVLVWDRVKTALDGDAATDKDHITISSESAEGGFYGDGHLSYSEGFRSGELKGYGYADHSVLDKTKYREKKDPDGEDEESNWKKTETNNAKVLNTIQRLDMMRLTDNCILINGARDYTIKEVSTTPYSIARVGELQMVSSIDSTATTPFPTEKKARNYVGLMNNIHYVGAVKSSVDFDRKFHKYDGTLQSDSTYRQKKYRFITDFYALYPKGQKSTAEITELGYGTPAQKQYNDAWDTFNLRNDATSLNMIGLSSGYALKIQGTRETDDVGTEELYYGPVDGIIEVKLIQPILDEGGGYVYADNVHDNVHEFLESTGNFVFPTSLENAQRVVDDCLLTKFDKLDGNYGEEEKNAHESDMHYWFLTGRHYFYNLHITGYTYDSYNYTDDQYVTGDIKGIKFDADTSDGLTILEGAKEDLVISGIVWNGHHLANGTADGTYNGNCDIQNDSKAYTLRLSASTDAGSTYYTQEADKSLFYDIIRNENFNFDEVGDSIIKPGQTGTDGQAYTSQTLNMYHEGSVQANGTGGVKPTISSPLLALQLVDNVNNAAGNSESLTATEYYEKHLSKPDTLQIELRSKPDEWNIYTINLIINYVKGPSYSGHLTIDNCALPGEYIKIKKNDITIEADESFAQNGEFLRIGQLNAARNDFKNGYLTYDASGETTSPELKGSVYSDPAGNYLMIPAYYFMNGYGVQYVFTCNNMSAAFPVAMQLDGSGHSTDTLVVHNYHRMYPHQLTTNKSVDLHLAEAVTRASQETSFAEPRIYLTDYADMKAFQQWVDTVGVNVPKVKLTGYADSLTVPTAGRYAQFFLQNDITMQQTTPLADLYYTAPANFAGTLHGDGHTINGITGNLFTNLAATGKVYNLGLPTGSIAGTVAYGGKIRTSFEYENLKVYNLDGGAKTYEEADFNDGKVAYNLNQYYLEARKYIKTEEKAGRSTPTAETIANQAAVAYLKDYYQNGDYQYALQYNATTAPEYLRTDVIPHYTVDVFTGYDSYTSFHNTAHTVDEARAVDKDEQGNYRPLYNAAKIDDDATTTVQKNDYIFFGQGLQATPDTYPSVIASRNVDNMSNRVYRASGFYQTKVDQGFHFNANQPKAIDTWIHNPKTTAIDFTGKRDTENASETPGADHWLDVATQKIFYAPAVDMPSTSHAIEINDDVTKNLLIYTADTTSLASYSMAKLTDAKLRYADDTDEDEILGHQIQFKSGSYKADRLHLVDMEDFNAPIQFTADSAWYIRDPQAETGYVNEAGRGWTSISLPFTVKNATLSEGLTRYKDAFNNGQTGSQTSITYFYGATDNPSDVNVRKRTVLGHEFWFRALNSSKDVAGDKAYFKRPLYGIDGRSEASDAANAANRSFEAYKPYIVSFPGEQFYEFDMTGQTIAFAADDAVIAVTDDNVTANRAASKNSYYYYGAYLNNDGKDGAYAIDVNGTGDRFDNGQHIYPFRGYLTTGAEIKGNSMNLAFTGDTSNRYILIGDDLGKLEEVLDGDIDRDPDGGVSTDSGLRVYGVGQRIVVVSDYATTLPVYTATGALVRVLDVRPGTATYSGFKQGIYVVDQKKIRLR